MASDCDSGQESLPGSLLRGHQPHSWNRQSSRETSHRWSPGFVICSLVKFQEQETKLRPSPLLALCPRKTFIPRAGRLCPFLWVTSSPGWVAAPDRTKAVPREAPVGLQMLEKDKKVRHPPAAEAPPSLRAGSGQLYCQSRAS